MSVSATIAPSAARRRAVAAPIPLAAPVTSATRPSSLLDIGSTTITLATGPTGMQKHKTGSGLYSFA